MLLSLPFLVEKGAPMSRYLMQEIINQRIFPKKVSIKWVGDVLKGLGLSWQLVRRGDHQKFSTELTSLARHRFGLKLHYLMEVEEVDPAHFWNLDETLMKILPIELTIKSASDGGFEFLSSCL